MSKPAHRQITLRINREHYEQIKTQALAQQISIQSLLTKTLNSLDPWPITTPKKPNPLHTLWLGFLSVMPPEKIEIFTKAMEWDLRCAKSARLKSRPEAQL
jgi:hypothetical protein